MSEEATSVQLDPNYAVHPGAVLLRVLEQRQIRQSELAARTGLSTKHINQLIKENIGISGDVAVLLERALGIDAEFWLKADRRYALLKSRDRAREQLAGYQKWAHSFHDGTLIRTGIVQPTDDEATRTEKLLRFFTVGTPDAFDDTWIRPRVSFRRSQSFTVAEHNTALWLRLVERSAEDARAEPFRTAALRHAARALPSLTTLKVVDGFRAARSLLANAGVVLTFVREVPETRVCGATWWLAADRPVIGVTERHRKTDVLWWTILHECGHLALHPRRQTFLDLDQEKSTTDTAEEEANTFAATTLLPSDAPERIKAATNRDDLLLLAAKFGIGPAIVAGQYGKATNQWAMVAKLRETITDTDVKGLERIVAN